MDIRQFISKWRRVELKERSASQEHFLDLCRVVAHKTPAEADPDGSWFTFEKGASKHGGGDGWADVWKKGFFGWEYKGRHKDLDVAYDQLLKYREALENPPLLVVCDMDRIVVHTNFTSTATVVHELALDALAEPRNIEILNALFHAPDKLKPGATSSTITAEAAQRLAEIAQSIRDRGIDARMVAHFLDRIVFCLFAEDVGLLPETLLTRIMEKSAGDPERFGKLIGQLFAAMSTGGDFGLDTIRHFNGNLFDDEPVIELTSNEMQSIQAAAQLDWTAVDPSIFGTLFERGMDPAKRSQLGAHYTSREDIETLVEPVVMQPLRREWDEYRQIVENLLTTGKKHPGKSPPKRKPSAATLRKAHGQAGSLLHQFLTRLHGIKVLDPACGSGNFLYVTLQKLKDLEKEVIVFAMDHGIGGFLPAVGPWQLYGIEVSPYAYDLAQMAIWIGFLQWTRANGFRVAQDPVLRPMERNFRCMDSIMDLSDPDNPVVPEWPKVDFIVGNPPFLGGKLMRRELGDEYMDKLFALWRERVRPEADLCCYWFEKAREHVRQGRCRRAGLLATQGIRGGANRDTLKRIKETGDIFFAESDRPWVLDGANVHVSMVGFDDGDEPARTLDGQSVGAINSNLTSSVDVTQAVRLDANKGIAFMGDTKGGSFDVPDELARRLLDEPNPNSKPTSDVLVPWSNGRDVTSRNRDMWIIDYGVGTPEPQAALYEGPFGYLLEHVKPARAKSRSTVGAWWQHERCRPEMRAALATLPRFLVTTTVSKHRVFAWMTAPCLPDHQLIVFARDDDYFFGLLHSRVHEVWARSQGTQVRERESGFRYTPTSCFETFPLPDANASHQAAVAAAGKKLSELRDAWLNPREWTREETIEFPGSTTGPWSQYIHDADSADMGTVRYIRPVPKDEDAAKRLKKRTLTALYNECPPWLEHAHRQLDEAVCSAYGWSRDMTDSEMLEALLMLNTGIQGEVEARQ